MKNKFVKSILTLSLLSTLVLSGCTNTNTPEDTTEAATTAVVTETASTEALAESIYPITIKHALGETVIESKPERVATIAWGNHDLPLALGVIPVGISAANYGVTDGSGMLPWTAAKFAELGVQNPVLFDDVAGLNFEAIADVQPDVILAAYSGITQEEYDLLSEIAPVVAYPTLPWQTFWRDQILYDAMGMGMQAEGEVLIKDLEALIATKLSETPQIEGKSAAYFYFNPADLGNFYVYLPGDPRAAYLTDLGMTVPESVKKMAEETDSFAITLSAENADLLYDIDLIIAYGNPALLEALQADPLLGTIPAIANGAVALIEDGTPLAASATPSALSIPATLDEYLRIIGEAADKIK